MRMGVALISVTTVQLHEIVHFLVTFKLNF